MPGAIEEFDPSELLYEDSGYEPLPDETQESWRFRFNGDYKALVTAFAPLVVGLVFVFGGLSLTGSYFLLSTRLFDFPATIAYTYQAGTMVAMIGAILIYDTIKKMRLL